MLLEIISVLQNVFIMMDYLLSLFLPQVVISKHLQLSLAIPPVILNMLSQTLLLTSEASSCATYCISLDSSHCRILYLPGSYHALPLYHLFFLKSQLSNSIL